MIQNVPSSPAAAHAAPDPVIKNVAPSHAGRCRAKTVQELILEPEMQALLHEADVKAAADQQCRGPFRHIVGLWVMMSKESSGFVD